MSQTAAIAHDDHHYTSTGLSSWKVGFWAFIGSECLFFASLISTYLVYKGRSVVGPYPEEILNIPLTSVSTFVLGSGFLGFQVYEFSHFVHEGLTIGTNVFGSSFFVLTGFHGAHVAGGVIWMSTLWILAARGKLAPADSLKVEIAGLYWHFVDIVWIVIFTLVYLIQ